MALTKISFVQLVWSAKEWMELFLLFRILVDLELEGLGQPSFENLPKQNLKIDKRGNHL